MFHHFRWKPFGPPCREFLPLFTGTLYCLPSMLRGERTRAGRRREMACEGCLRGGRLDTQVLSPDAATERPVFSPYTPLAESQERRSHAMAIRSTSHGRSRPAARRTRRPQAERMRQQLNLGRWKQARR